MALHNTPLILASLAVSVTPRIQRRQRSLKYRLELDFLFRTLRVLKIGFNIINHINSQV
jgi:hypothetical protein